jgi:hypothetical protein
LYTAMHSRLQKGEKSTAGVQTTAFPQKQNQCQCVRTFSHPTGARFHRCSLRMSPVNGRRSFSRDRRRGPRSHAGLPARSPKALRTRNNRFTISHERARIDERRVPAKFLQGLAATQPMYPRNAIKATSQNLTPVAAEGDGGHLRSGKAPHALPLCDGPDFELSVAAA